jgi:putative membrane protein
MTAQVIAAYVHFMAMIALGALLCCELMLLWSAVGAREARRLAIFDLGYLVAAVLVLVSGVLRLTWLGKSPGFYLQNPVFWIKLALFVAIALISIPPTMRYLRWRRAALDAGSAPHPADVTLARRYVVAELVLLAFIPLTAVLAARGIGLQG